MQSDSAQAAQCVIAILRKKGHTQARVLVRSLLQQFPGLDEEEAGEIIWGLLEERKVRVTDEAELEASEAMTP